MESLQRHISSIHDGERHSCNYCEKTYTEKRTLKKHIKAVHEEILNHKCDLCDVTFEMPSGLQFHMDTIHKGQKKFQCESCEKSFTASGNLKLHKVSVHKISTITDNKCGFCDKYFIHKGNPTKHLFTCNTNKAKSN